MTCAKWVNFHSDPLNVFVLPAASQRFYGSSSYCCATFAQLISRRIKNMWPTNIVLYVAQMKNFNYIWRATVEILYLIDACAACVETFEWIQMRSISSKTSMTKETQQIPSNNNNNLSQFEYTQAKNKWIPKKWIRKVLINYIIFRLLNSSNIPSKLWVYCK